MSPADAFFVGYISLGVGASLSPGDSITVRDDLLKPRNHSSSYIQNCRLVGMEYYTDGRVLLDKDGRFHFAGDVRFDCQARGEPIKLEF
ncbi:MAG: hypothetical protein GY799_25425 [Desulfobulbaceae bacterium]|nr:hypothetical protein [Desulfobulbaceae bacterium]